MKLPEERAEELASDERAGRHDLYEMMLECAAELRKVRAAWLEIREAMDAEYGRTVDTLQTARAERDRYRAALEWYADMANYDDHVHVWGYGQGQNTATPAASKLDRGKRARAALEVKG